MGRPTPKSQRANSLNSSIISTREDMLNRKSGRERDSNYDLDLCSDNCFDQFAYDDLDCLEDDEEDLTSRDLLIQKYSGSHRSSADYDKLARGNVDNTITASLLARGRKGD